MITGLIALIGILLGGFWFQTKGKQSAEALLANSDDKDKIRVIEGQKDVAAASLIVEEQKRKEAEENAKKQSAALSTDVDVADYFNNKPKS